jgi:hypothetical protein
MLAILADPDCLPVNGFVCGFVFSPVVFSFVSRYLSTSLYREFKRQPCPRWTFALRAK